MTDLKKIIPKEFFRGRMPKPVCMNVAELIRELQKLPKDLPVHEGFNVGVKLIVYNIDEVDPHLGFVENVGGEG